MGVLGGALGARGTNKSTVAQRCQTVVGENIQSRALEVLKYVRWNGITFHTVKF